MDTSNGEEVQFQNTPGATFEAINGIPINVKWINEITTPYSLAVDPFDYPGPLITNSKYEIPIVIQDRSFNDDGNFAFPDQGDNPEIHPYCQPEFFGEAIIVNGKVWPNLNVDMTRYRFRILNGSNARFYNLKFSNQMQFWQIGTDGGYLNKPVPLTLLLIAPGERADILLDFTEIPPGTRIILENDANAPYPTGDVPDPNTVGQIMQFTVQSNADMSMPAKLPKTLRCKSVPRLVNPRKIRILTLYEIQGPNGTLMVTLNGQPWSDPVSELSIVGSIEDWYIVNLTMDAHPIHLHLVQFKVLSRQRFEVDSYTNNWLKLNSDLGNSPWMTIPKALYNKIKASHCNFQQDA